MNTLRLACALLTLGAALAAQIPISGNVSDGAGGPLLSGNVYHAVGGVTVPNGTTLTIQPGAVVKFNGALFTVAGTLLCNGTAANPVFVTSIHDDAAGGDTNGNGNATTPAAGNWAGINFASTSSASTLNFTTVRYCGSGGWAPIYLSAAHITLADCTVSDATAGGMYLANNSRPTVTRCSFARCAGAPAIFAAELAAVPGFTNNTVSANPGGNFLRVESASLGANCTIQANNVPGGALVYSTGISVAASSTLTLGPGVVLKATGGNLVTIAGTLRTNGTAANPVVFTSIHDDAAGGDTNGNGNATTPVAGNWAGLYFTGTSSASTLNFATVRYCGTSGYAPIYLAAAHITLADCTLSDATAGGMYLANNSRPTVTRCTFARCAGAPAIHAAELAAVPGFTNNTVTANPGGNFLRVESATLGADCAIQSNNLPGGALVYSTGISVQTGVTLTLGPGVVLKATGGNLVTIAGTLRTNGTAASPVVFTSIHDDAAGGDTNGNGNATTPAAGNWAGLYFTGTSSASTLNFATVRYCGTGGYAPIYLAAAHITLADCTLSDATAGGMYLANNSRPTVTRCTFARCAGAPAIYAAELAAVPGFTNNTVTANPGGNFLRVESATPGANCAIQRDNVPGGALVYSTGISVPAGVILSLGAGVVLKASGGQLVTIAGTLQSAAVFTAFADDSYGGDTNGNGASSGAPGSWAGISFAAGGTAALNGTLVRYCGTGGYSGIYCLSAAAAVRGTRVEHGSAGGFYFSAAAAVEDTVAYANQGAGYQFASGTFDVRRSSAVNNTATGFTASAGWSGQVASCLAFGNPSGGFAGFAAGRVHYSNGSGITGGSGNLNVDPQLADAANGDLRLLAGSPCVDTGDPTDVPTGTDLNGFPRWLDGDLNGVQRVDMGAFEFDNLILAVYGTASPGQVVNFVLLGTPSINVVVMLMGVAPSPGLPLPPYGALLVDVFQPFLVLSWPAPPSNVPVSIPLNLATPALVVAQAIGFAGISGRGNLSNAAHLLIR